MAGGYVQEIAETKVTAVHQLAEKRGFPLRAGVEIPVLRKWNLDVSAVFGGLWIDEIDLTPVGLGTADLGSTWGVLIGTTCYP